MFAKITLSFLLLCSMLSYAQVGIGTTTPNANSLLDIESTNKGLLIPRVALTGATSTAPLTAHVAGMTVYNTATVGNLIPGFYYNNGTQWVGLDGSNWKLNGNAGTVPATNFIGTTDLQPLILRTNNVEQMRINADGWIGIGTNAPTTKLHADGTLRFSGINEGAGRVLTSDATGNATWQVGQVVRAYAELTNPRDPSAQGNGSLFTIPTTARIIGFEQSGPVKAVFVQVAAGNGGGQTNRDAVLTPTVPGIYRISYSINVNNTNTMGAASEITVDTRLNKVANSIPKSQRQQSLNASGKISISNSFLFKYTTGDISLFIVGTQTGATVLTNSTFNIELIDPNP